MNVKKAENYAKMEMIKKSSVKEHAIQEIQMRTMLISTLLYMLQRSNIFHHVQIDTQDIAKEIDYQSSIIRKLSKNLCAL